MYNEQIHDLLEPKGPLAIREDPDKGVVVQGLSFHQVWDWARVAGAAPLVLQGSLTRWFGDALDPGVVLKSSFSSWGKSPGWGDHSALPGPLLCSPPQPSSCWSC